MDENFKKTLKKIVLEQRFCELFTFPAIFTPGFSNIYKTSFKDSQYQQNLSQATKKLANTCNVTC